MNSNIWQRKGYIWLILSIHDTLNVIKISHPPKCLTNFQFCLLFLEILLDIRENRSITH